jgi:hypothetical protein
MPDQCDVITPPIESSVISERLKLVSEDIYKYVCVFVCVCVCVCVHVCV